MPNPLVVERLFAAALEASSGLYTREELEAEIVEFGTCPISRVQDWRKHVPDEVCDEWEELPLVAKLVAFFAAKLQSPSEQWE